MIVLSFPRMGSPEEKYLDTASELSEEASGLDGLWQPDRLCKETNLMSGAESARRSLARKKLVVACVVSLVFMIGEVIGERKKKKIVIACHKHV